MFTMSQHVPFSEVERWAPINGNTPFSNFTWKQLKISALPKPQNYFFQLTLRARISKHLVFCLISLQSNIWIIMQKKIMLLQDNVFFMWCGWQHWKYKVGIFVCVFVCLFSGGFLVGCSTVDLLLLSDLHPFVLLETQAGIFTSVFSLYRRLSAAFT